MARPSIFTQKLVDKICDRIAHGESVRSICKDKDMPSAVTIYYWLLDEDKKEFFKQYARAKDSQAELMFDELLEIADNNDIDVNRLRLRVDTRKWYLSKVLPKKYGDKLDMTTDGKPLNINFDNAFIPPPSKNRE
jgi:hypothetical protein